MGVDLKVVQKVLQKSLTGGQVENNCHIVSFVLNEIVPDVPLHAQKELLTQVRCD